VYRCIITAQVQPEGKKIYSTTHSCLGCEKYSKGAVYDTQAKAQKKKTALQSVLSTLRTQQWLL